MEKCALIVYTASVQFIRQPAHAQPFTSVFMPGAWVALTTARNILTTYDTPIIIMRFFFIL